MTLTEAMLALVKDHCYGRHQRSHPRCSICVQRRQVGPEWVRRARAGELPAKELGA